VFPTHLTVVFAPKIFGVLAIRFAGWATDAGVAAKEAELRTWIEPGGLRPVGPPTYAYYDDPWMPGPPRRNEVLLDVSPE
jgi:predicted Zn-dependent protease